MTVQIAYAHNGNLRFEFHIAVMNMTKHEAMNGRELGEVAAGGSYIVQNRNVLCSKFLESDSEWMLMMDTDMVFPPDMIERMLKYADPVERPILSALYFTSLYGKWLPVWLVEDDAGLPIPFIDIELGEVYELHSTGMGFIMIHRTVLEKMLAEATDPWPWYAHDILEDGQHAGEDVTFCVRARNLGYKIHGLAYPLVHMKTQPIDWYSFKNQFSAT
jgi:hypothetical protein